MKLTAQAISIVTTGVDRLDDHARHAWACWLQRRSDVELSPEILNVVDRALSAIEDMLRERLTHTLDDDQKADAINDLRFSRAVHTDLLKERSGGRRSQHA